MTSRERWIVQTLAASAVVLLFCGVGLAQTGCNGKPVGGDQGLSGFVPFPADSPWNTDISAARVDPNSADIIDFIGSSAQIHPDFGSGAYRGRAIGIPYQVVQGTQPKVPILLRRFPRESDPGPMPIPPDALVEGYPVKDRGDRHLLVIDRDGCWLYELYGASKSEDGQWSAGSSAIWDMTIHQQRPYGWTSTDAAGLPVFPGLVRYEEVAAGEIRHALRFTVRTTRRAFVPPASHWASRVADPNAPPMGMRVRLKAGFDVAGFPRQAQVILTALKKYGMILADNGSPMYISGAPHPEWDNDALHMLGDVTAGDFEVVRMDEIHIPRTVPSGRAPVVNSFTADPAVVDPGQPVTLSWKVRDATYNIISPQVGPVRGDTVVVIPAATTTYTIYATNQYGRNTKSVNVTVR